MDTSGGTTQTGTFQRQGLWGRASGRIEMGFHHVGQSGLELLTSRSTRLGLPKCWDYKQTRSPYVAQAGPEFLGSGDPLASSSQSVGITGLSHSPYPILVSIHTQVLT
ncbi:hypothetical protein AAY473_008750, partial [Plecturocebus cupreus]